MENVKYPAMITKGKYLGNSFDEFIEKMLRRALLNQMFMFSKTFDIYEAVDNVLRLQYYFFLDNFRQGINDINYKLALQLEPIHIRKSKARVDINKAALYKLREMLTPEYNFLSSLQELSLDMA